MLQSDGIRGEDRPLDSVTEVSGTKQRNSSADQAQRPSIDLQYRLVSSGEGKFAACSSLRDLFEPASFYSMRHKAPITVYTARLVRAATIPVLNNWPSISWDPVRTFLRALAASSPVSVPTDVRGSEAIHARQSTRAALPGGIGKPACTHSFAS